jgi:hypothetical protein
MSGKQEQDIYPLLAHRERNAEYCHRECGKFTLPNGVTRLMKAHRDYLRSRGFDPKELYRLWRVHGIDYRVTPSMQWRIFIPIYGLFPKSNGFMQWKPASWTARAIGDKEPRYMNALPWEQAISAKNLLYGQQWADRYRNGGKVLITEGPFDVWRYGPGAVATLGTGVTDEQFYRLINNYRKFFIVFDAEPKAQERAKELAHQLSGYSKHVTNVELDAKDLGSAKKKEVDQLRKHCKIV